MLKLRLLTGPRAGRQLRVSDTKPVSVGRRKGRLRLHDSRVSKQHAEIYFSSGAWILRDEGSVNGTYVNRKRVKGLIELEPGDLVQMGRVLIKIIRADSIGMDTPPGMADDLIFGDLDVPVDAEPVGTATALSDEPDISPGEVDDDIDLDALFAEGESQDENDQSGPLPQEVEASEPAPQPVEPVAELDDLTPVDIAFDEVDSNEDSFFHDVGEETDVTDGADLMPAVSDVAEPPVVEEPEGEDDDLYDLSSDSPIVEEVQGDSEEDPFLGRIDEADTGEESSGDLISLDDEDHAEPSGPPGAGTTLLTAEHHDEIYEEDIPPEEEAAPEEEPASKDEPEDGKPALVGLHLDQAPPQQPEPPTEEPEAAPADEAGPDDVADQVEPQGDESVQEDSDPNQGETPEEEAEPADTEPGEVPSAEAETVEDDPAPAFDIDAAFDALSEGLDDDDSLDVPPLNGAEDQAAESPQSVETLEEQAGDPEPLAGSQLDVGFIKDALAKLEEQDGSTTSPDSNGAQNGAAPAPDSGETGDDAPPMRSPLSQQSPPPGINPTSIQQPQEPGGSYQGPSDGKKKGWFFSLLLFLVIGGVSGWLVNENYESWITGRDDDASQSDPDALAVSPVPNTPGPSALGDPAADPDSQPAPTTTTEPVTPAQDLPDGSPNPFAPGPGVIGGDAIAGITGGEDGRPLDAPRLPGTLPNRPSPITQPDQPGAGPRQPAGDTATQPGFDTPGTDSTPPTAPEDPARIVFLVDASGSLVDSLPQMLVWLNEALQTIEPGEQFAVFFFKSGKVIPVEPSGLIKPTRDAILALSENWLNPDRAPVLPSGRSNPTHAIRAALKLDPTDMYVLSDESFAYFAGDTTSEQAQALVTDAIGTSDVRVHGVQFFYRDQGSVLETLSNRYEGTFEFVREKITPDGDPIDLLKELGGE